MPAALPEAVESRSGEPVMLILVGSAVILAVTAATAFFVVQEFAYVAVDRSRLRRLADDGDAAAAAALRVTGRLSFVLSGAQLGITVTALFVGFLAEPYLGIGLREIIGLTGLPTGVTTVLAMTATLIVANLVQMVLGELAPKNLAIARTVTLARWMARPTLGYLTVASPLIRLFDAVANRLLRLLGIEPVEELPHGASADDLHRIIDDARDTGQIEPGLSALLDRSLDFRGLTAGQVMTPRVDVETVPSTAAVSGVVTKLTTGRSRFPVTGDGIDDIVGVMGIAELLTVPRADRDRVDVGTVAATPLLIPESLPLPDVLERLRTEHRQLACVVDEYGGLAGVVSFEDVAEELVGDIRDEADRPQSRPVRRGADWLLPARWRVDEIAAATGVELPASEEYETLGGLVMTVLGRVPEVGDTVEVDAVPGHQEDPVRVRLEVMSVRRRVPGIVAVRPVIDGTGVAA